MANNDCTQADLDPDREARTRELEDITGQKTDRHKLDALERKSMSERLDNLMECLGELLDVQTGLQLVLKLHDSICADEERAFFTVLDILSSSLKTGIERSKEMIP